MPAALGLGALLVVAGLVSPAVGVTTPLGDTAAPASALPEPACEDLLTDGVCRMTFSDYAGGASFSVPEQISTITVLVAGGGGGGGGKGNHFESAGPGGGGALIVGTIQLGENRDFVVFPGDVGESHDEGGTGFGWTNGGKHGEGRGTYADGGGGGGSTAIGFGTVQIDQLIAVAGGGGGGGGNVSEQGETASGGGEGGQGGSFDLDGTSGSKPDAANGAGGAGAASGEPDGQHGQSAGAWWDVNTSTGGGGGGGGYQNGGAGGEFGQIATCNFFGKCPPDGFAGAGGGGGAGDSFRSDVLQKPAAMPDFATAAPGEGYVMIYTGDVEPFGCIADDSGQSYEIPDGIQRYAFIMTGGAGTHGHSADNRQGTGALVHGIMDVSSIDTLTYWVGCSGYNGGYGWGTPGEGGHASAVTAKDGGRGGAASLILNGDDGETVIAAAGGGGGSGGDAACLPDTDSCSYTGGRGGSGGGVNGTRFPYDGEGGDGKFDHASGGCANCMREDDAWTPDGGHGSHSHTGGGGGGGGAGYPAGGEGGHEKEDGSGGGGGAGGSYLGPQTSDGAIIASASPDNGFILLIAIPTPTTTLTVTKEVTGDGAADYGHGPFTFEVTCPEDYQRHGTTDAGGSVVFEGVPQENNCEVTETVTGGATVPATPQQVEVQDAPASTTMTNEFSLADLTVTLDSIVPDVGTGFTIGELTAQVHCTFDGRSIPLPGNGELSWSGPATLNDPVPDTIAVPIGAECGVTQTPPPGDPTIEYSDLTVTVGSDGALILITDTYTLVPVTIAKAIGGDGDVPPEADFTIQISCTFNGEPVTLATSSVTLGAGGSAAIPNLPQGAACDVVETDRAGATTVTYEPASTFLAGQTTTVTVRNTYTTAALTVSVSAGGAAASWLSPAVLVTTHVTCTLEGEIVYDESLDFPSTGGVQVVDVDEGAECQISEPSSAGAAAITFPLGQSTVIGDAGNAALEVHNRYDAAPIVVTSANSGAGAEYANLPTTVLVDDCEFNGVTHSYSALLEFGIHGGTHTAPGIAVGARCDVVQTAQGGATSVILSVTDGDPVSTIDDGVRVTVAESGPTTVDIDNVYDLAALEVTKTLTGDAAWAANTPTTVEVTCRFNDQPVHRLGPDGIATLQFSATGELQPGHGATALETLNVGTVCDAVETETGGGVPSYLPEGEDRSGTVTVPGEIAITNDFPATTLTVAKSLGGNDAAAHVDDVFPLATHCTFNGIALPAPPGDVNPAWSVQLGGGQSVTYELLPVGAECRTVEGHTNHATMVVPGAHQTTTLDAAGTTVTFTNVFDLADLTVRQVITGEGAAVYGDPKVFLAKVECEYADGGRIQLPDDGYVPLNAGNDHTHQLRIPVGATCSIDEENANHATELTLSAPQTIHLGDTAILEASTRFDLATLHVRTIARGTAAATTLFDYTTHCVWPDPTEHEVIPTTNPDDAAFTQGNGAVRDIQVLMNSFCTVVETGTGGALRLVVTAEGPHTGLVPDGAAAELFAPGEATFVFDNYLEGSLPVTGAEVGLAGLVLVALLLLVGAVLVVVRRYRRGEAA